MNHAKPELLVETMAEALELKIVPGQKEKLKKFAGLLLEGLQKKRLTGEKTAEEVIGKHFYDSLYPLKVVKFSAGNRVLDLGSGGGLPGMPLKICREELLMYLMDSNQRKINFLRRAAESLALENIYFLCGRAEEWGKRDGHREQYDIVLSRAVAEMAALAELALPLVKIGGQALFYKGPRGEQEALKAGKAIEKCGGELEDGWTYRLPTGEQRKLYRLRKARSTPPQYPRAVGKPVRRPIT